MFLLRLNELHDTNFHFDTMTTNLKSGIVTFLAVLTLFGMGASNAAFGGCYCMMESMSVAASYNKTGFNGYGTNWSTLYLADHYVEVSTAIWKSDSQDIFYSESEIYDYKYDISTITNIYWVGHPDCREYTL